MVEDIEKLEVEMMKKREEMGSLFKELQERTKNIESSPMPTNVEGLKEKERLQILKEMQIDILDKKTELENALRETQEVAKAIKELRRKPHEEIEEAIKILRERAVEKKEALEKAIREMEEIKEKYTKKFYG